MRVLVSTSLFVLALGCQPQSELEFQHLSTMKAKTQGLVLMDDGQVGHAGMAGTTCRFDTLNGWLIDDFDLPTEDEVTQSAGATISHDFDRVLQSAVDAGFEPVHREPLPLPDQRQPAA